MEGFNSPNTAAGKKAVVTALALLTLAFSFWSAGLELGAAPPADPISKIAAGEKALARLKELGADVSEVRHENQPRWIAIRFHDEWLGTDGDLKLLDDVTPLGEVLADIDLQYVTPQAVSQLKLRTPLDQLGLDFDTDQPIQDLTALPSCRRISVWDWHGTPEDYRHFAALAAGVEDLNLRAVESFDGSRNRVGDDALAELTGLTSVKLLHIDYSKLTNVGLNSLSGMKRLEQLWLTNCPGLDGADLGALANFPALRKLHLGATVSAAGLANIGKLAALEELDFPPSPLNAADAEPLGRLTHLKSLSIMLPWVSRKTDEPVPAERLALVPLGSVIASATATMPLLEKLFLELPTDEKGLAAVATHAKLEVLSIDLTDANDQSLALVGRLSGLKRLILRGEGKLSDQGLASIASLTALTELTLPGAGLTDSAFIHLADLTALENLTLPNSKITGARLAAVRPLTRLSYLDLAGSLFDDRACRLLPELPQLQFLDLSHTKITDAGLESLAKISTLSSLKVNDTAITDHGVAHLAGHKTLSSIEAQNTSVTEEAVAKLQEAFPEPPQGKFESLWIRIGDAEHTNVFMSGKTGGKKTAASDQPTAEEPAAEEPPAEKTPAATPAEK